MRPHEFYDWQEIDFTISCFINAYENQMLRVFAEDDASRVFAYLVKAKSNDTIDIIQDIPTNADVVITRRLDITQVEGKPNFFTIAEKEKEDTALYPWQISHDADISNGIKALVNSIAADPKSEGLIKTPDRFRKAIIEICTPEEFEFTTFDANGHDQMIFSAGLQYHTLCEHHILPFFGTVDIAYIPSDRIVGLSKLARCVDYYSRALNTQEYFTQNIANRIQKELSPVGVGVVVRGRHMCQEMRGAKKSGEMITSFLGGAIKDDPRARNEFYDVCNFR